MTEQTPEGKASLNWGASRQILRQLGALLVVLVCWGLVLAVVVAPPRQAALADVTGREGLNWDEHVFPVVQQNCLLCHGTSGGLSLATYEDASIGGAHGPAIVPGDAEGSLLHQVLLGPVVDIPAMPLGQAQLPQETIDLMGRWIDGLPVE